VTEGTVAIKGTMTSDLALTGKVRILKAEIRIPDKLPVDVEEIAIKEINLPPARQAAADAAAEAAEKAAAKARGEAIGGFFSGLFGGGSAGQPQPASGSTVVAPTPMPAPKWS
jgi:hypothetical protein